MANAYMKAPKGSKMEFIDYYTEKTTSKDSSLKGEPIYQDKKSKKYYAAKRTILGNRYRRYKGKAYHFDISKEKEGF